MHRATVLFALLTLTLLLPRFAQLDADLPPHYLANDIREAIVAQTDPDAPVQAP